MGQYDRKVNDVHRELSEEAASIANAEANKGVLPFGVYGVFTPKRRKLGLTIDEFASDDPQLLEQLHTIGVQAVKQALIQRPDLTVGLIVGDARNGNNYFDRWS